METQTLSIVLNDKLKFMVYYFEYLNIFYFNFILFYFILFNLEFICIAANNCKKVSIYINYQSELKI